MDVIYGIPTEEEDTYTDGIAPRRGKCREKEEGPYTN
jgi:hypothetical protein